MVLEISNRIRIDNGINDIVIMRFFAKTDETYGKELCISGFLGWSAIKSRTY